MAKKFRLKEKPVKPERMIVVRRQHLIDDHGISNAAILCEILQELPKDAQIRLIHEYDSDYCHPPYVEAVWQEPETDAEFNARLAVYNVELAKYQEWETNNKDEIAEHLRKKEEKVKKAKESNIKQLKQQLAKLTKQLEAEEKK